MRGSYGCEQDRGRLMPMLRADAAFQPLSVSKLHPRCLATAPVRPLISRMRFNVCAISGHPVAS